MKWLVVTDVHGNLPALEAVLRSGEARACGAVISLGDHTNFGPQPRQVHDRLTELGAIMLMGNHERRLLNWQDPIYDGWNWELMRWTAEQMRGAQIPQTIDWRIGDALLTHATPGNPEHLVDEDGIAQELDKLDGSTGVLVTGHNHCSWQVTRNGRIAVNPGSLGMYEGNAGGIAPFAILEETGGHVRVRRCAVTYSPMETLGAFARSECVKRAPEITRMVAHTMFTGEPQAVLRLVRHVGETAKRLGLDPAGREAWLEADWAWPWPEAIGSTEYWKTAERKTK